jgi:hypothetical protein
MTQPCLDHLSVVEAFSFLVFPLRVKSASPPRILRYRSGPKTPSIHEGFWVPGVRGAADLGFLPFPVDKMTLLTNHQVTAVSSNG